MKLRTLLLRKKIDDKKKALAELQKKDAEFEQRRADLTEAFSEVTDETPEEERAEVENQINQFDADFDQHEADKKVLEDEIAATEEELNELEEKQEEKPAEEPAPAPEVQPEERGVFKMNTRDIYRNMTTQERTALVGCNAVKNWLGEIRAAIKEKRAITGVGLTIPTETLPLLREITGENSKLYPLVNRQSVAGEARQPIMGTVPEAFWTECCAYLNEMDLAFSDWSVDCYKVGGFFVICNANIEDSDVDLLATVLAAIGKGISKALDKAILYGRNISANANMPLGIVTRLLQTSKPSGYPTTARDWVDLHTSNIKSEGTALSPLSGVNLLSAIVVDSAVADTDYTNSELTWIMSRKTHVNIMAATLVANASGVVIPMIENQMPVIGGKIIELNFIPENVMIFGHMDMYLLAERAGANFASSEHVRFLHDQTVYKGTARYDGAPVIAEAFGVIAINGASVDATAVTFPQDEANSASAVAVNKTTVSVATAHTVTIKAVTTPEGLPITFTSADTSKATVSSTGVITGVATGTTTITVASGNANQFVNVTVTAS